jgi:hypothetical protein
MEGSRMNRYVAISALGLAAAASTTWANDAGVLKCRAITDTTKRLACYDAIDLSGAAHISAPVAKPGANAAAPVASPAAATVATKSAPPGAAPASPAAEFGLPPKQTAVGVDRIETTIKGYLDGWQQGSRIRLANGQLWQVTDDSRGVCDCTNRKVVVTRGAFGTYFLEIEGKGNAPRVKRLE